MAYREEDIVTRVERLAAKVEQLEDLSERVTRVENRVKRARSVVHNLPSIVGGGTVAGVVLMLIAVLAGQIQSCQRRSMAEADAQEIRDRADRRRIDTRVCAGIGATYVRRIGANPKAVLCTRDGQLYTVVLHSNKAVEVIPGQRVRVDR